MIRNGVVARGGCEGCGKTTLTVNEKLRVPRLCNDCLGLTKTQEQEGGSQAMLPVPQSRRMVNPFKPPRDVLNLRFNVGLFDLARRLFKAATILTAVTIILLPATPIALLGWIVCNLGMSSGCKKAQAWFAALADQYSATVADIGVYVGGHPLLPSAGRCALLVRNPSLLIVHQDGLEAEIPLVSIEFAQGLTQAKNVAFGAVIKGFAFFHQPADEFLQVGFVDDKGFRSLLTIGAPVALSPDEWSNCITSARYSAA